MNRMVTRIWALALLAFLPASVAFAQSSTKAKVQIRKNVNGQEEIFTEEFDLEEGQDIQDILRELDLLDEFGQLKEGQAFEISIKKMDVNGENQDVNLLFSPPDAGMNQAFFGVYLQNITDENSAFEGAEVSSVIEGTKADEADMQDGDIIYKVDNTEVSSVSDLVSVIQDYKAGEKVKIYFYRDGKKEKVTTELGIRENDFPNRFFWDEEQEFGRQFGEEFGNEFEFEFPENGFLLADSLMIAHFDCDKNMERVEQPFLGVTHGGYKNWEEGQPTGGLLVGNVVEGSSAQEMGLEEDDIIESFNGQEITTWESLVDQIEGTTPGDEVVMEINRGGQSMTLEGAIGSREVTSGSSFKIFHDLHGMDEEGNVFYNYDFEIDKEQLEEGMNQLRLELEQLENLEELEGLQELQMLERLESLEDLEHMFERNIEVITEEGEDGEVTVIISDGDNAEEREVTVTPMENGQMQVIILDDNGNEEEVIVIAPNAMEDGEREIHVDRIIMEERNRAREGMVTEEVLITIDIEAISDEEAATINENADIQLRTSNDLSMESISFFPNPTQGQLNLNFEVTPIADARLDIILYDQIGNIVYRESQTGFDGRYNGGIDISGEADGAYYLQILYGDQSFSRKVVKN